MKEYEQVKSFYKLKSEDDGQAAKDADKEIKQYNALYAAAVKNGYSVTDEQVQAYIEDMKLQLESVDNSEDIQDVIDQFDSEDDYWAYEFTVYQKQLPIQNYVSALNDEYNEKAVDSSSEEAQEEWDTYFENLKDTGETYASSHFVIGMDGEIVQCIPCNEIAYASNDRNEDTIAIECCIPDETGEFTDATYQSLIELTAWLMGRYDLTTDDVIRHYDVTGKMCPKYYVEHEDAWLLFKQDLLTYIDVNGIAKNEEIS